MKPLATLSGALLVDKHPGVSSFGIIEDLQGILGKKLGVKRRELPKMGHGGSLDPFATGMLTVCVGRGVKLARYFLGADKTYEGLIRFGETTVPGDPTSPVSARCAALPENLGQIQEMARKMTLQPYLQTPPMHSAKKKDGRPLYELARQGIEIEREPKLCHLRTFEVSSYEPPLAQFRVQCSSGTYIRTLAQDLAGLLGTVGMLDELHRVSSGVFVNRPAWSIQQIAQATEEGRPWDDFPCWVPFDRLLESFPVAEAMPEEAQALLEGRQKVLFNIVARARNNSGIVADTAPPGYSAGYLAIYQSGHLLAVARNESSAWEIERVFPAE